MDKSVLVEFIQAAVDDHEKATRMLRQNGALLNARYLHNETVLHFHCVEGYITADQVDSKYLNDQAAQLGIEKILNEIRTEVSSGT